MAATLQHLFGKSRMADAVNAGLDLHALFAANRDGVLADLDLNRMTEPDVAEVIKQRISAYKDDKKLKPRRQLAKMANFYRSHYIERYS